MNKNIGPGKTIVVDNGSGTIKFGFASSDEPRVFPNIVGHLKKLKSTDSPHDYYVGNAAQSKRDILTLKYPMQFGLVANWDDMEKVWYHIFYQELKTDPGKHSLLLTEPPITTNNHREKMTQIMFENFNVPSLNISVQPVLSLFASGSTTGTVLDFGDSATYIVPIQEGHALRDKIPRCNTAGRDLTYFLMDILSRKGYSFTTPAEREVVREIKEKFCYVALDYKNELTKSTSFGQPLKKNYKLPDGKIISIGNERFRCPEALFQPKMIGLEMAGIHQITWNAIKKCNFKNHQYNIILSGGSSMFPGLEERLQKEITALAPSNAKVMIKARPNRKYSAWLGGSLLAALPTFQQMSMTKAEYNEFGPSFIHQKCS